MLIYNVSSENNHLYLGTEDQGEKSQTLDRSHIVGHINRDGSIRPVVPVSTSVTANASSPTFTSSLEHDHLPVASTSSAAASRSQLEDGNDAKAELVEKITS